MIKGYTSHCVFKYFLVLVLLVGHYSNALAQCSPITLTLQPNAINGMDAEIGSHSTLVNTNLGNVTEINAMAWTVSSVASNLRSLIRFDLSSIPANAVVQQATFTLFNNPTTTNGTGSHSGSNAAWLQKITSAWSENTVTWNTQPTTTTVNQVALPQSTSGHQDYSLDVTTLIQDMVTNPATNFGFMLRLQTETALRALLFASSDYADPAKWPRLSVVYSTGPLAIISAGGPIIFCSGGSVTLSANTGAGLSHQWQLNGADIPGATSSTYAASVTGSYTCRVTDTSCTQSNTINVTVENSLAAVISASGTFCSGGSVLLNANSGTGLSYQWQLNGANIPGAISATYSASNPGSYTCIVSNSCGSSASNAIAVTSNSPTAIITAAGSTNICSSGSVILNATTGAGLTYQWKSNSLNIPGATSSSYTVLGSSGDYTCMISNGTCNSFSNTITVTATSGVPSATITAPGQTTFCSPGGSTALNAAYGSQNTYQWNLNGIAIAGATTFSYNATLTGNYTCSVTNICGTAVSNTIPISFNPDTASCGETLYYSAQSNDYNSTWRNYNCGVSGGNTAQEMLYQFTPPISGNYEVNVFAYGTGNTSANYAQWFYKELSGSCDTTGWTCLGAAGSFGAYTVPKSFTMGPLTAGVTYVILVDAAKPTASSGGFASLLASFRINCLLCSSAPVSISTSAANNSICSGNSVTLTQNGGVLNVDGDYHWYTGSCGGTPVGTGSSVTVSPTANTTYYVRGESSCGNTYCVPVTVYVDAAPPVASISLIGSTTICQGTAKTITAASAASYTYQWRKNGIDIAGETAQTYNAGDAGNYTCMVTNACGSVLSNSISIFTQPCNMGIQFGSDRIVKVPRTASNEIGTGDFTLEAWVRTAGLGGPTIEGTIFSNATSSFSGLTIQLGTNGLIVHLAEIGVGYGVLTPNAVNDTCHHIAVSRAGTVLTFYMDGILLGTRIAPILSITNNFDYYIGRGPYFYYRSFPGRIRDVAFWNVAISQAQVQSSMNNGLSGSETGLIGYWKLDDGSGQIVNDYSSANNDAMMGTTTSVDAADPLFMPSCQCSASGSINASGPTAFCPGGAVSLAANPGSGQTYQWRLNGVDITGATSISYSAIASGDYTCAITDICGPQVSNIITVTVTSTLPPAAISAGGATTFCAGSGVTLNANTGIGISWQWQLNGSNIPGATASVYLANATGNYTCILSNSCGSSTSNSIAVTVNTSPAITQQPANAFVCAGNNTSISLVASGSGLTYQWKDNGANIVNGAVYSGATTAILSLTGTPANYDLKQYTCVVSGTCTPSVTSAAASLSVGSATPAIAISGNGVLCSGATGTFTALPQNAGLAPTYQWKKNGVNVGTNNLIYSNNSLVNGDIITCSLTTNDPCSQVTVASNAITITIITSSPPAVITANRTEWCSNFPDFATLSANTGAGLTYQWKEFGFNIPGATASTYNTSQSGQYTCLVSNSCGSTLSNSITITVYTNPNAQITAGGATTFCVGGSVQFTASPIGYGYIWIKDNVDIPGATSRTYTATTSGTYNCYVYNGFCGSYTSFYTVTVIPFPTASITAGGPLNFCSGGSVMLSANTGAGLAYQWKNGGVNISGAVSSTYSATSAGSYSCVVSNGCGSPTSNVVSVSVDPAPSASITAGGPVSFCAGGSVLLSANTGAGLTYQWKNGGVNIPGAISSSYSATSAGNFTCVVTNGCGSATSNAVSVALDPLPPATITATGSTSICVGRMVGLSANTGAGLSYQWKDNGVNIPGATSSIYGATVGGSYTCEVTNTCGSTTSNTIVVTLLYPPSANITAQGSTAICPGSNVKLVSDTAYGVRYQWMRNGLVMPAETLYQYTATAVGNYTCEVSNNCDTLISNTIAITIMPLPSAVIYTNDPTSFCSGSSAKLNVNTNNGQSFQWQLNGVNISGATGLDYTAGNTGNYTCVVTGPCGTTTSNTITLTSIPLATATITATGPTSFCVGGSVTLNANTGAGLTHQWKLGSSNINGATASSYNATAAGSYTCVVSNTCGAATSNSIAVTVSPLPSAAITAGGSTTICQGSSVMLNANTGAGLTYQWKLGGSNISGATASSYNATATGSYSCVVTNGCGSATSNSIAVTINPLLTATITAAGSTTICSGGSVTLNANTGTGLTYQWKRNATNISGATASSYNATTTGSYTCAVTNACGTATSNSISVTSGIAPATPSNISGSNKVCPSTTAIYSVTAVSGVTFNWTAPSAASIISGQGTHTVTVSFASNFNGGTLSVTASNTCGTSSARTKAISKNNRCGAAQAQSLPSNQRMLDAVVYPNPASDHFTLSVLTQETGTCRLVVHDLTGRVVEHLENISPGESVTFGQKLSSGVYLVEVIQGEERKVLRVVKNQ